MLFMVLMVSEIHAINRNLIFSTSSAVMFKTPTTGFRTQDRGEDGQIIQGKSTESIRLGYLFSFPELLRVDVDATAR